MPNNKRWLVFTLCLLVLTISLVLTLSRPNTNNVSPQSITSSLPRTPPSQTIDATLTAEPISLEEISALIAASSLDGTQAPGTLQLDPSGNLIVDNSTKDILDYFLSLSGEMPDENIRHIIFSWALETASSSAANELMDILARYQAYRHSFASGDYAASGVSDLPQKMAARRAMRDEIMGTRISTDMFASDDAYDEYSMTRLSIVQSDQSDEDKQVALATLMASLPEEAARQIRQEHALTSLPQAEKNMRESGATDADIYTYRQQEFGGAAAQRMEALDQQRSQWQHRYEIYQERKKQITQSGLAQLDQQAEIEKVRAEMFNETEQLRISAMERIDATHYQ